ncbi:MAG: methylmalonyl Co-A mutase-associated GTPase MeaB [Myxococcales bacterium]
MLADSILRGDVRAASRLMRAIDDRDPSAIGELRALFRHTGRAWIVGVTGSPGAGKSTLVDQLVSGMREAGRTVGVVAVDPTSPFSGGAILGDRVRMQSHATDPGVFIRSLATRGSLGGLSRATSDVVRVLDAMGKDVVVVETVGVGQDELDVARLAHTVLVVVVPGMGDDVQALKAGILEIADVFAVNKADHEGADRTLRELRSMLELRGSSSDRGGVEQSRTPSRSLGGGRGEGPHGEGQVWTPRVLPTVATSGQGMPESSRRCGSTASGWPSRGGWRSARWRERKPSSWPTCASGWSRRGSRRWPSVQALSTRSRYKSRTASKIRMLSATAW